MFVRKYQDMNMDKIYDEWNRNFCNKVNNQLPVRPEYWYL